MDGRGRSSKIEIGIILKAAVLGLLAVVWVGCASTAAQPKVPPAQGQAFQERSAAAERSLLDVDLKSKYHQGLSYLEQGRLEEAQSSLESLTASHSDRIELHNALGVVYRRRAMPEKAIAEYQTAIALTQRSAAMPLQQAVSSELYNNLAIAYRENGDFKKAEEAYLEAIASNSNFAPAYYNLGVLYDLYQNRLPEAVRYYRDYEKLAGKNETVDVWIADLEQRMARGVEHATE